MEVILNDSVIGVVNDYNTGLNKLIQVSGIKTFFIPFVDNYIIKVEKDSNKIFVSDRVKDLMK